MSELLEVLTMIVTGQLTVVEYAVVLGMVIVLGPIGYKLGTMAAEYDDKHS